MADIIIEFYELGPLFATLLHFRAVDQLVIVESEDWSGLNATSALYMLEEALAKPFERGLEMSVVWFRPRYMLLLAGSLKKLANVEA